MMQRNAQGQQIRRWVRYLLATALLVTAAVAVQAATSEADGASPPAITLTLESSDEYPGMLLVDWDVTGNDPTGPDYFYDAFRLEWATVGATTPATAVSLIRQELPFTRLIIPGLEADTYAVTVSGLPRQRDGIVFVAPVSTTQAVTEGVTEQQLTCPDVSQVRICVTPSNLSDDAIPNFVLYNNTSSGDMSAISGGRYVWIGDFPEGGCGALPTTTCPASNSSEYFLARVNYRDRAGLSTTRWWSAFGDSGHTYFSATPVLVPVRSEVGSPVMLNFDLTEGESITLEGELSKLTESGSAALELADIVNPCVKIFNSQGQFVNLECAFNGSGFQAKPPVPDGDPGVPGYWRIQLPKPADGDHYRVFFVDRANYFGADNLLNYNVNFAAEWAVAADTRLENFASAVPYTATTPGLNAILRPAKQLRVDITDVPAGYTDARISVYDAISDRWFGGALATVSAQVWGANVTGLVDGRPYRIFLNFSGPGAPHRLWLVGGGDRQTAPGIVPGPTITEPWPNLPYAVTVHNADGSLISQPGSVCVALIREDSTAASNCNDGNNALGSPGIVLLQRVIPGTYQAIAWRESNPSAAILIGEIVVPQSGQLPFVADADYAAGISNYTNQTLGELLQGLASPTNSAVIIP